ncbi:MAG: S8 family serine peptidase [Bacteroidota bacterium]
MKAVLLLLSLLVLATAALGQVVEPPHLEGDSLRIDPEKWKQLRLLHRQKARKTSLEGTNREALLRMSEEFSKNPALGGISRDSLYRIAKQKGWFIPSLENRMQLYGIDERGNPIYAGSHNAGAAALSNVDDLHAGGSLGLDLSGEDMTIGMWEVGGITNVAEFYGRAVQRDSATYRFTHANDHAMHVAGTMIAGGIYEADVKGMAYKANMDAYEWNNDLEEMSLAARNGLLVSNHSYGVWSGWERNGSGGWNWYGDTTISSQEDYKFGFYDSHDAAIDRIAYNAPYYLIVRSAGNQRNHIPDSNDETFIFFDTTWVISDSIRFPDGHVAGAPQGYDNISMRANAKNLMLVGAVTGNKSMTNFSSWGPTDDGRIKPDIVADGHKTKSTVLRRDLTTYTDKTPDGEDYSGTSMSAPVVSGAGLLLQEHYSNRYSRFMKAATLKALMLHTAEDLGNTGPDYQNGWGLLDAQAAVAVIDTKDDESFIWEETLNNSNTWTFDLPATGNEPLVVTIVWNDPAATPLAPALDDPTPRLVNDLDIRVSNSGNTQTYQPWILDPANPTATATNGDNVLDNVEQIYIASPNAENYQLTVSHKGSLTNGKQPFSVIVTGIRQPQPLVADLKWYSNGNSIPLGSGTLDRACEFTAEVTLSNPHSVDITGKFQVVLDKNARVLLDDYPNLKAVGYQVNASDNTHGTGSDAGLVTIPANGQAVLRFYAPHVDLFIGTMDIRVERRLDDIPAGTYGDAAPGILLGTTSGMNNPEQLTQINIGNCMNYTSDIVGYEYFYDNDLNTKIYQSVTSSSDRVRDLDLELETTGLTNGQHQVSIRYKDNNGNWSPSESYYFEHFSSSISSTTNEIYAYQYWFDSLFMQRQTVLIPANTDTIQADTTGFNLKQGTHVLHIRYQDARGLWSSVESSYFQHFASSTSSTDLSVTLKVVSLQYWFDFAGSTPVTLPVTGTEVEVFELDLAAAGIPKGNHVMYVRYQDTRGLWSATSAYNIEHFVSSSEVRSGDTATVITQFQYWFDDDLANANVLTRTVSLDTFNLLGAVNLPNLSNGYHDFHFRCKDNYGRWSSVYSNKFEYFQRLTPNFDGVNRIENYQYWFNQDVASRVTVPLSSAATTTAIDELIDLTTLTSGTQEVHIRFQDSRGQWGSVVSYAVVNLPNVTLLVSTIGVRENSGRSLDFTFTSSIAVSTTLTINFSISGSASSSSDYMVVGADTFDIGTNAGTISIPAGQSSVLLRVFPIGDALIESDETVIVTITPP